MSAPPIRCAFGARRRLGKHGLAVVPLLMLAACGEPAAEPDAAVTTKLPPAAATPQPTVLGPFPSPGMAQPAAGGNAAQELPPAEPAAAGQSLASSRYTSLDPSSCTPIDDGSPGSAAAPSGSAAARRRCAGPSDYALETSDSGDRQDLAIVAPGGRRAGLDLEKRAANGRLGKTAEWRRDGSGRPRALIVRVDAARQPGAKPRVSDLVVARLTAPPCIVAVIPRGPGQNEKARAIADGERLECME